jgi:hypothetical protein
MSSDPVPAGQGQVRTWKESVYAGLRLFVQRFSRSAQQREVIALLTQILARQQEIITQQQHEKKWRSNLRDQVNAVLRRQIMSGTELAQPYWLSAQRFRLRSQNEEDGVTLALLTAAGVTARRFVEIGSGSSGGNSAVLAFELGWTGLMVEASKRKTDKLRQAIAFNPGVTVVQAFVTPAKFNGLLRAHGCKGEVDFMSIDIDSTDYWLLDTLHVCSPRVLVMEYNALFGADRALTLPAEGLPARRPKGYFGASLAALEKKAREKGYRLVHCDHYGVNAFFLRNDVAPQIVGQTPAAAFRPMLGADDEERVLDVFALIEEQRLPLVEV